NLSPAGFPESFLVRSGSGPLGPKVLGGWQSLQPPTVTRYSPRCTGVCAGAAFSSFESPDADLLSVGWVAVASISTTARPGMSRIASPCGLSSLKHFERAWRISVVRKRCELSCGTMQWSRAVPQTAPTLDLLIGVSYDSRLAEKDNSLAVFHHA